MRIHGRYLTLILRRTSTSCTRLGIVASKKIGGAVERNRAKRRVRDLFRRQSDGCPALDVVVIPRPDLIHAPFPMLAQDFRSVWRRGVERLASRDRG